MNKYVVAYIFIWFGNYFQIESRGYFTFENSKKFENSNKGMRK